MSIATERGEAIKRLDRGYCNLHEQWRNILFCDSARARLEHTAGFLLGMESAGQSELAESLAADLCKSLDWLNNYGGPHKIEFSDGSIEVPSYKIRLFDDGTFGGFSVLWYRAVDPDVYKDWCVETPMFSDQEPYCDYETGIAEKYRLWKELTETRYYKPTWWKDEYREKSWMRFPGVDVRYRYSFNGGLLFHGFGYNSHAITLSKNYWSIHT